MVTVYLVDGKTRMHLPASNWGFQVRETLLMMGHRIEETNQPQYPDTRDKDELARVDALLISTGL